MVTPVIMLKTSLAQMGGREKQWIYQRRHWIWNTQDASGIFFKSSTQKSHSLWTLAKHSHFHLKWISLLGSHSALHFDKSITILSVDTSITVWHFIVTCLHISLAAPIFFITVVSKFFFSLSLCSPPIPLLQGLSLLLFLVPTQWASTHWWYSIRGS